MLLQVDKLTIPMDFVVLDIGENHTIKDHLKLLGSPFMATARTTIDVLHGKLTMTVLGEMVEFDVFARKKKKVEFNTCYNLKTKE